MIEDSVDVALEDRARLCKMVNADFMSSVPGNGLEVKKQLKAS